ncbi:MAG TPA: TetR/AcrR family transcriptional regulator [Acidimicrobiales bacterium]|nr:TetR/AcrR family transcriptional regulator [Acidimicrobiales bacterium]
MPASTRDRLLDAGAALLQRQGFVGTGVKQIVSEAGAPFASLYHFFPGGKEALGVAVVRVSGARYGDLIPLFFEGAPDVAAATEAFFLAAAETVRASDYADACPIATVALEVSSTSEPMRVACAETFESWLTSLASYVGSRELALVLFTMLEGAFIHCRATRTTESLEVTARIGADLVRSETSASPTRAPRRPRRR